jgi:hypothetical protein
MQICWWEAAELLEHFRSRPDIWIEDSGLWMRKTVAGTPAFGLQLLEPDPGPYRMYTLSWTPVEWDDSYVEEYLDKLVYFWTSASTRFEFERLMVSELALDPEIARLMAVALMKATVDPGTDPELSLPDPKQEPLWHWDLPWPPDTGVEPSHVVGHNSLPTPGGSITITEHGEMLRVRFEITTARTANGWHSIAMQGFCRPLGYTVKNFLALMRKRSEPIETEDPDSQLDFEEILREQTGDSLPPGDDLGNALATPDLPSSSEGGQPC